MNGRFDPPRKFTHDEHWRTIQIFSGHVDRLSERRWKLALQCNAENDGDDEALRRALLFIASCSHMRSTALAFVSRASSRLVASEWASE